MMVLVCLVHNWCKIEQQLILFCFIFSERYQTEDCFGCYPPNREEPLPSQRDHSCTMMDWNETVHTYFERAMRRTSEKQVTDRWISLVNYASTKPVNGYEMEYFRNGREWQWDLINTFVEVMKMALLREDDDEL